MPEVAHHNLVAAAHCSFKGSHGSHLHTITLLSKNYWWPGLCYDSLSVYLYTLSFSLTFLVSHDYQHRWATRGNLCTYTTLPTLMFFFWYLFPIQL